MRTRDLEDLILEAACPEAVSPDQPTRPIPLVAFDRRLEPRTAVSFRAAVLVRDVSGSVLVKNVSTGGLAFSVDFAPERFWWPGEMLQVALSLPGLGSCVIRATVVWSRQDERATDVGVRFACPAPDVVAALARLVHARRQGARFDD